MGRGEVNSSEPRISDLILLVSHVNKPRPSPFLVSTAARPHLLLGAYTLSDSRCPQEGNRPGL